ncbi:MAG: tryptophan synthase subunit alpha [Acidimicrobiia bacterium]
MSAERLAGLFEEVRREGRPALLPYLTAGLPDLESSPALFRAMAEAGADGFEVGLPYSDPLMDGPTIQAAAARALAGGVRWEDALQVVEAVVSGTGKPTVVMTYANPVFLVGVERFAVRAAQAGASGIIVADLPVEEAESVQAAAEAAGLGLALFVAPTTHDARLVGVAARKPAFIYGVADLGVTGERERPGDRAELLASRVRAVTDLPLVMGVGISTPEQVRALVGTVDGVIVGSALVRRVLNAAGPDQAADSLRAAVGELAAALRLGPSPTGGG